jgi:hypothetical protein
MKNQKRAQHGRKIRQRCWLRVVVGVRARNIGKQNASKRAKDTAALLVAGGGWRACQEYRKTECFEEKRSPERR